MPMDPKGCVFWNGTIQFSTDAREEMCHHYSVKLVPSRCVGKDVSLVMGQSGQPQQDVKEYVFVKMADLS